ncbi:lytic transglycosylase domain-containing protein [Serratia sp. D1N4]
MPPKKKAIKTHEAKLTPKKEAKPEKVTVDETARLREIRKLVEKNNASTLSTDLIICHIYMESRFDKDAHGQGSSARGLMQLLKAPVRELYRMENLNLPRKERRPEPVVYKEADVFHNGPSFVDEATNIRTGTTYLQLLLDKRNKDGSADPIAEAYKDYRGVRNGIYYKKIKAAADKLKSAPESMEILRDMVK